MNRVNATGRTTHWPSAMVLAALLATGGQATAADEAPAPGAALVANAGAAVSPAPVVAPVVADPARETPAETAPPPETVTAAPMALAPATPAVSVEPPAISPGPADAAAAAAAADPPGIQLLPEPEATVTTPLLVGPDDDRLLQEIEKHVGTAPVDTVIRIAEQRYDIPLELNAKVLDYVEIFQTTRRRSFEAGLARSRKYEDLMKPIFRELGLPTDLYYLALIESGYNPKAYSYAKATGIWQFMSSTGSLYGLRRTDWLDERRDPEKSTRAAARHLKDLYDELGSWPLALAAYNAGKGRVQRALAKAGTDDFWSLDLPAQTRNYVPAFFAAVIISKDPERYGFQPEYDGCDLTDTVEVGGGTRLSLVAAICQTSVDSIQHLNPELRKATVPPGGKYLLKIPAGRAEDLRAGLSKVPANRATEGLSAYRAAPGDTLFALARRFGTTPEAIRDANRLKGSDLRTGQKLLIPGQRVAETVIPRAPGRVVVSSAIPSSYRVLAGDNPWSISRRFNVRLEDLLAWNDLGSDAVLSIGQTLVLREPATVDAAAARAAQARRTYEVRKGDNLWQIARKFEASLEELQRLNGFGSDHALQPGDRVLLP